MLEEGGIKILDEGDVKCQLSNSAEVKKIMNQKIDKLKASMKKNKL